MVLLKNFLLLREEESFYIWFISELNDLLSPKTEIFILYLDTSKYKMADSKKFTCSQCSFTYSIGLQTSSGLCLPCFNNNKKRPCSRCGVVRGLCSGVCIECRGSERRMKRELAKLDIESKRHPCSRCSRNIIIPSGKLCYYCAKQS